MRSTFAAVAVTAVAAALALAGCSGQPNPPASSTMPAAATTGTTTGTTNTGTTNTGTTGAGAGTGVTGTPPSGHAADQPPVVHNAGQCAETANWNTEPESNSASSPSALYNSRIGRHDCFDRVVFDVNGPEPVGFDVRYVPEVTADGSGKPIPVAGGAALQVVVRAPAQGSAGDTSGHQPGVIFAPSGAHLHGPGGLEHWGCLREVRSAGSFEGQTTFAVGVRERLPFRVASFTDANQITHLVLDIAC